MKKWILILSLFVCPLARAVPVTPAVVPHLTFVDASGAACASCSLYTYAAGTTTPLATYSSANGTSMNTNPIVLDAAGGANIWMGANSYKFVLKNTSGGTIWSVDQVNAGGFFPCGPAYSVQIANSAVTGLSCDARITINTSNHTLNIGTVPTNHVTIGALGTPTAWVFDTTTPATARASIGAGTGTIDSGTIGQLAYYAAAGTELSGTSALPNGTTASTQTASDSSTKVATTAYVAAPGAIGPVSVALNGGTAMTANQGTGVKVQHSTGTTTANNCAKYDAAGNTIDALVPCAISVSRINCLTDSCSGGTTYASGGSYTNLGTVPVIEEVGLIAIGGPCTGADSTLIYEVNYGTWAGNGVYNNCQGEASVTFIVPIGATFVVLATHLDGGGSAAIASWYESTL